MVSSLTSRCAGVLIVAAAWLPGAWAGTVGGSLEWAAHDHGLLKASSWLPVLVRFRQPPTAAELEALEAPISSVYPGGNPPGFTPGLDWL